MYLDAEAGRGGLRPGGSGPHLRRHHGGTTGKITVQHGLFCRKLLKEFGPEAAALYRQAQEAALERYRALCREIDCDFEERDNFIYSANRRDLEEELEALSRTGAPAVLIREPPLPFPTAGAVQFPGRPSSIR